MPQPLTPVKPPRTSSVSVADVRGQQVPRLWTRPLRELTEDTTYGYDVIDFARNTLGRPLDPWQEWLVIHAGELLPDGRPRFKTVLVLVARQNGKTELLVILALFWLFIENVRLVLGTSTNLDYARESWEKAVDLSEENEALKVDLAPDRSGGVRRSNGEQSLKTKTWVDPANPKTRWYSRYKIAASNRKGGRSLTIDRLILDELREHDSWEAWNAASPATNAVRDAQIWGISNQGDDKAVVLNSLRDAALGVLAGEVGDQRLGLFEWSAPDGSKPTDIDALSQANPNLGYRLDPEGVLGDAMRAERNGGEELAGFLTEILCMKVPRLDPAIDGSAWAACMKIGTLEHLRSRVVLCLDVSMDSQHASLVACAQLPSGPYRLEVVEAWSGQGCVDQLRKALPGLTARVRPKKIGWFPNGPAATLGADLMEHRGASRAEAWPPFGVEIEEIRSDTTAVCMGLAEQILSEAIVHSDDPMLNAHVTGAEKLRQGDAWRFIRKGAGHCDGAYAAAGAVWLARTLPPVPPRPMVLKARSTEEIEQDREERRERRRLEAQETSKSSS